jgi:hypothetical protein
MNAFVLFLYLLKATLTTFSGLASLSVLRQDLVLEHHVVSTAQYRHRRLPDDAWACRTLCSKRRLLCR